MPTVIHQLADAFLKRKQALSEGKRAKSVLPGSDYFMPKSAKEDLNNRLSVFEQGGLPELLKQGASEMYRNPIVNTAISLTPGAGDVQSGYEAVQSAKEGKWGEAGLNALGVLPFIPSMGMIGKTVWHGSPHTFDKFDLSKIGTGEGAQVYGHGLYLAEAPETASMYKGLLSKNKAAEDSNYQKIVKKGEALSERLSNVHGVSDLETLGELIENKNFQDIPEKYINAFKQYQNRKDIAYKNALENTGALYKVDLPDEQIAKMLDWDKPLSQQAPEIQAAIKNSPYAEALSKNDAWYGKEPTADQLYFRLSDLTSPKEASQYFASQGVPGIQYLDQASRGAGEGTRNYVVFSDKIPKILERNGTSVFEFPKD